MNDNARNDEIAALTRRVEGLETTVAELRRMLKLRPTNRPRKREPQMGEPGWSTATGTKPWTEG